jgi:multidrug resistance efflux pump
VFAVLALVSAVLGLIALFGHVQIYAEGRGVLRPDSPPALLRAPFGGTVRTVERAVGQRGRSGDVLVTLDVRTEIAAHDLCAAQVETEERDLASLDVRLGDWNAKDEHRDAALALVLLSQIRTQRDKVNGLTQRCEEVGRVVARSRVVFPIDGAVDDVAVAPGSQVHEGDALATIVSSSARLVGYLVVPEAHRNELAPGGAVRLKFDALPYEENGVGVGRVTRLLEALPSGTAVADGCDEARGGQGTPSGSTGTTAGAIAEIAVDAMPAGALPRRGMTFTADVLAGRPRILSLLFGSP